MAAESVVNKSFPQGIRLDPAWLRRQLQLRCWGLREAAEASGVSTATISAALNDNRIGKAQVAKIQRALADNAEIPGMAEALAE